MCMLRAGGQGYTIHLIPDDLMPRGSGGGGGVKEEYIQGTPWHGWMACVHRAIERKSSLGPPPSIHSFLPCSFLAPSYTPLGDPHRSLSVCVRV